MSAALHEVRAIWRATTVQRDAGMTVFVRWLATGLLAIGMVTLIVIDFVTERQDLVARLPEIALRSVLGIGACWLGVLGATLFMPASVQLNSAANARLLPRQRRRLMQLAFGCWLLTTVGLAGAFGSWVALTAIGLYALGFMLLRAGFRQAVALLFFGGTLPVFLHSGLPSALTGAILSPDALLAADVVLVLTALWALRIIYPAGGDTHLDQRAARLKAIARFGDYKSAGQTDTSLRKMMGIASLYSNAMARACCTPAPAPGRMLLFALGPVIHWSVWVPLVVLFVAVGGVLRLASTWIGGAAMQEFMHGFAAPCVSGLVSLIVFSTAILVSQLMRSTGGEQALLRLTPLAGDPRLLNRRLALQLLNLALANWIMLSGMILVMTLELGGFDRHGLVRLLAFCCLAGQVSVMGLLGDYANGFGWRPALALQAVVLAVVQVGAAMALGWFSDTSVYGWLTAIAIGTAIVLLRRDWRRMLAAPAAFPAGRLA